ncbi:MAG: 50S ribosomal protein L24 [Gammaproteobacteria bacterium]|nr:50S ribosomal protein L24 [Gammaproteobacteria bacterium]MYJ75909.1 50S ribosomal protein L24 [Gammaproteobacteria bacterium]
MRKLRKQDEVVVIAGRDRGKRGEVLQFAANDRLIVAGINLVKKHARANPMNNDPGGIKDIEAPIAVSNVALVNPETGKADRVGIREENGKRVRYFKSTNTLVDKDE